MSDGPRIHAPPESAQASGSAEKASDGAGASAAAVPEASRDVVVVNGPTDDGEGVRVVRLRDDSLEVGEMRALKEGAPITSGDVVRLHAREGSPMVWDVEVQYSAGQPNPSAPSSRHPGPARVSSAAYRKNWDSIFGATKDDCTPESQQDKSIN